ncbi:tRNA (adenosine(37)-N6)-threonylcarbamoyltransferase complex dimerization subunit type 1 TsaB [Candidatus Woesearchaeota archaeon]|nr:tRNA (adenosine(37)-N6)-threonylcarbamoyltransferase complex dimerization subunit type 1 TsaB [Candidatus Woesearchaeota archaeon]
MNILALETATEACSAALWLQAGSDCLERYEYAPRAHNLHILPMLDSLLAEAGMGFSQLDAIAFGCGPGSFTGVRMAAGVAQGLAFGADLPVIPVSTLATMAWQVYRETAHPLAYPCIDARMGEVYWAAYRCSATGVPLIPLVAEQVIPAGRVSLPEPQDANDQQGWGIGSGYATYGQCLSERLGNRLIGTMPDRFPTAGCIARLAAILARPETLLPAELALPVYLRDDVAQKPHPPHSPGASP